MQKCIKKLLKIVFESDPQEDAISGNAAPMLMSRRLDLL
jgi:hypothetical protein